MATHGAHDGSDGPPGNGRTNGGVEPPAPRRGPPAGRHGPLPPSVGFLIPSVMTVRKRYWEDEIPAPTLGVPTLAGYLRDAGLTDRIAVYDFDADLRRALLTGRTTLDVSTFSDDRAVDAYLASGAGPLAALVEELLALLAVGAHDVYGFSLSAPLGRYHDIHTCGNLALALASELKRRHRRCVTVAGGLQISPESLQPQEYRQMLARTPALDVAVYGAGEKPLRGLLACVTSGGDLSPLIGAPDLFLNEAWNGGRGPGTGRGPPGADEAGDRRRETEGGRDGLEPSAGGLPPAASSLTRAPSPARCEDPLAERSFKVPHFTAAHLTGFTYTGQELIDWYGLDAARYPELRAAAQQRLAVVPAIFQTGCPGICGFCAYSLTRHVAAPVAEVVAGLRRLREEYDVRHFHFLNTQINSSYEYAHAFCDALLAADLDLLWSDCCFIKHLDEALLDKLAAAGCVRLVYGVESPNDTMFRYMRKGCTIEQVERLLRHAHALGLWNQILLIPGMPYETDEVLAESLAFLTNTAPIVDSYSISPFYLVENSSWGRHPAKHGIERVGSADDLLENVRFHEQHGLHWDQKQLQIRRSADAHFATLRRAKGHSRAAGGAIDLYLVMFLYRALGRARKPDLRRLYDDFARRCEGFSMWGQSFGRAYTQDATFAIALGTDAGEETLIFTIDAVADRKPHFHRSRRFTYSYTQPGAAPAVSAPAGARARGLHLLLSALAPVLTGLDERHAPADPAAMATLARAALAQSGGLAQFGGRVLADEERKGEPSGSGSG